MATKAPTIGIHKGTAGGITSASKSPVVAALKSVTVMGFLASF
jgi:hypothetical protein